MKNYILMHKNNPVAIINIKSDGFHVCEVINEKLMPLGTINSSLSPHLNFNLTSWNNNRCIPLGRPNYESLSKKFNISDSSGWVPRSYMCSLTDCYWFKEESSVMKWENVNFYKNGFSSNLYKHLFYGKHDEPINHLNSPDITTDGYLKKMWIEKDGSFYLIKDSTGNMPIESYNECLASRIFQKIGINCVNYWMIKKDGRDCCISQCFIQSDNEEFITAESLIREYGYNMENIFSAMTSFGFEKEMSELIVGDYIIGNTDRHSKNFGIIIDADTQKIKRFAPIFDNGASHFFENGDNLFSHIGNTEFIKAIGQLDPKYLNIVDNLNEEYFKKWVNAMDYMSKNDKEKSISELLRRVETVKEIIREKEINYGREY